MNQTITTLSSLYWNTNQDAPLRTEDGCSLDDWLNGRGKASFAFHPKGFPVFLSPAEIASSDEYLDGDPYLVVEGLQRYPGFQNRRYETTLKLVSMALERRNSYMLSGGRILDVACGEGHLTAEVKEHFPDTEVFGIDYSISAIEKAFDLFSEIEFCCGDAYALPYPPSSFDVVLLNNIWEHVPDPLRLLNDVKRVLVPGGHVVISTPSRYRFRNMVRVCLGKPVVFMSKLHVTEYTVGQVVEQLRFARMDVQVFDEPLRGPAGGALRFVVFKFAVPSVRLFLRLIGSHHSPEETVFYLGKKQG